MLFPISAKAELPTSRRASSKRSNKQITDNAEQSLKRCDRRLQGRSTKIPATAAPYEENTRDVSRRASSEGHPEQTSREHSVIDASVVHDRGHQLSGEGPPTP